MSWLVFFATNVIILVASAYVIVFYSKLYQEFRVIGVYVLLALAIQIPSYLMGVNQMNNMFFLHIYVPSSFVILTEFYKKSLKGFINSRWLDLISIVFVLFSILNSIFIQSIDTFNSYALTLECLFIVIYSLSLFILLLNSTAKDEKRSILGSLLWVNSGLFIYHTINLFLSYFGDLLTTFSSVNFRLSWIMHSFIYIAQFSCILIGLWKLPKKLIS
jgi:hypothetical protein